MKEEFLYYLWRFQYFNKEALKTCQGEKLTILHPGTLNSDAGPDFINSHLIINDITWHGHVEIHVNASAWQLHHHQADPAYNNVVLHVVWDNDSIVKRNDGTTLPTLVLKNRVAIKLITQYKSLLNNTTTIPCAHQLADVSSIVKLSTLDSTLFQRLTHKNNLVYQLLKRNKNDWEETAYQLLAYNFGFKINSSTLLDLSLCLPLKLIRQNRDSLTQLEALFFGQAGLLNQQPTEPDEYWVALSKAYHYLTHKYRLSMDKVNKAQWKFFRLRPANFPTIRISQFVQLLHHHPSIFHLLLNSPCKVLYTKLAVKQSAYWQRHYHFAQPSKKSIAGLGKTSIENILINTTVPLLIAYGKFKDEQVYVDKAVSILQSLPAEHNKITRYWASLGMQVNSAFDSQALIELFNNFCSKKQCLSCNIGVAFMKGKK